MRQWSDRKKKVDIPVISGYIFVRCCPTDLDTIKRIYGVSDFLRFGREPYIIDSKIIADLNFMLSFADEEVEFSHSVPSSESNVKVKVVKGKLKGLVGELVDGASRIAVRVGEFGCAVCGVGKDLEFRRVE